MHHLPIQLRLVLVQHHLLGLEFLVTLDFDDGAARDEELVFVGIGGVLLIIESETWIIDLIENVEDEEYGSELGGSTLRRNQSLPQIMRESRIARNNSSVTHI